MQQLKNVGWVGLGWKNESDVRYTVSKQKKRPTLERKREKRKADNRYYKRKKKEKQ